MNRQNNHQTVNRLMLRLGGVYREPSRVLNDSVSLLNSNAGQHLRADISDLLLNDGTSMHGLRLSGTISMIYRGNTYHIPIDLHLPPNYAVRPPIIYVRPVATMMIKQGHKHVGADGMLYMPYLHSWSARSHNLIDAVLSMSRIFGEDPPVFARPAGSQASQAYQASQAQQPLAAAPSPIIPTPTPPPPPQYHAVATEQERLRQLEKEANEANEAVRIAREAERKEAEEKRLLTDTKQKLNDKTKVLLTNYHNASNQEITSHVQDQVLLEKSSSYVKEKMMVYYTKRKEELQQYNQELDNAIAKLESFIEEAELSKKSQNDISVDQLAVPADVHSAQMLVLSAENAAIHDALYFLDKGLSESKISLDVHLKVTRKLARRQFLIKAHLLKIGQVKASQVSQRSIVHY